MNIGRINRKAEHCSAFLFDSHCHLTDVPVNWQPIWVDGGLSVTTHPDEFFSLNYCRLGMFVSQYWHFSIGLHPWFADLPINWSIFENIIRAYPLLSIGEIGLDGSANKPDYSVQKNVFSHQLSIANHYNRVVSVHLVKDRGDGLKILKHSGVNRVLLHGFCGSLETARRYQSAGWVLGIGPRCLSRLGEKQKKMLLGLDQSLFVLESDSPYTCHADKTPDIIRDIAIQLANLWQIDVECVIQQTQHNFINLFEQQ